MGKKRRRRAERFAAKARSKDNLHTRSKLAEGVEGSYRIKSDPPLLLPLRDLSEQQLPSGYRLELTDAFEDYRSTLAVNRRHLLGRFRPIDAALKVVGVGSVGTRCAIMLLEGRDHTDPLFLQIKEATSSVLEEYLSPSPLEHHGQRVVEGQRLTQAVSDIFLGWTRSSLTGHHYYWRQLRDWKGSANIETASPQVLLNYTRLCGWTLARAHARTGTHVVFTCPTAEAPP